MPRNYSFKLPDDLATKVDDEADHRKLTYTDVIRQAVEEYFQRDRQRQNFEALVFEVVKNRAVLLRCFDMAGKELSAEVLEEAAQDATAYLEQKRTRA